MEKPQSIRVGIAVAKEHSGRTIADRIACRNVTRIPRDKHDLPAMERKHSYQASVLDALRLACSDLKKGELITRKFQDLAETLDQEMAVAVSGAEDHDGDAWISSLKEAWMDAFGSNAQVGYLSILEHPEILRHPTVSDGLVHPLFIALLAYQLGGPVTAANSATAHQWKLPDQSNSGAPAVNVHLEGDNGDIFSDHRLSLVWEENEKSTNEIGKHHIFPSADARPRTLATASTTKSDNHSTLLTILYDSKNAALAYECQDPTVMRKSISLDLQLDTIDDDINRLLDQEQPDDPQISDLTLLDLLTNFPIPNYNHHFNRLLFSPTSLQTIVEKLLTITITFDAPTHLPPTQTFISGFQQRFEAHCRENIARIPPQILAMEKDIPISGTHASPYVFISGIITNAMRDSHLPMGADLFPYDAVDESGELARKFFRDQACLVAEPRVAQHAASLTQQPLTARDILSTQQLQNIATMIAARCLELISTGFLDQHNILPSLPSFCSALGNALNGVKETQVTAESQIGDRDFQIYRVRCLYLFWCADWLVDYFGKPVEGPFMLREVSVREMAALREGLVGVARGLLRNWVAWGLFVEGLGADEELRRWRILRGGVA